MLRKFCDKHWRNKEPGIVNKNTWAFLFTFSRRSLKFSSPDKRYLGVIYCGPRFDCLTKLLAKTVHCNACPAYHEGQVACFPFAAERNAHVHVFLVAQVAEISCFYTSPECYVFQDWTLCAVQFFLGWGIFNRDCNIEYRIAVSAK